MTVYGTGTDFRYMGFADEDKRARALVESIRSGDIKSLEELIHIYGPKLTHFAESITGSPDLGGEAVQDMFIALWEQRESLDVRENIGGYLYRAVRNRALNIDRRERSQYRIAHSSATLSENSDSSINTDNIEKNDLRKEISYALREVPPRCQEIFFLIWGHELSYEQVADVLGVGVRTVQNQYYRAVAVLAKYFGP